MASVQFVLSGGSYNKTVLGTATASASRVPLQLELGRACRTGTTRCRASPRTRLGTPPTVQGSPSRSPTERALDEFGPSAPGVRARPAGGRALSSGTARGEVRVSCTGGGACVGQRLSVDPAGWRCGSAGRLWGQLSAGVAVTLPSSPPTWCPDVAILSGIDCPSASQCLAVGATVANGEGVVVPVSSGTPGVARLVPGAKELTAVACRTAASCVAVGVGGGHGVDVDLTNGTPASAQTVLDMSAFDAVSCSRSACYGAGRSLATGRHRVWTRQRS